MVLVPETLVAYLPKGSSDIDISKRLQQAGIIANPLSGYTLSFHPCLGLVLGYAPYRPAEIEAAVRRMKKCLVD